MLHIQDAVRGYISDLYIRANYPKLLEKSVTNSTEFVVSGLEPLNEHMAQKREVLESKTPELLELEMRMPDGTLHTETVKCLEQSEEGRVKEERLQDDD